MDKQFQHIICGGQIIIGAEMDICSINSDNAIKM